MTTNIRFNIGTKYVNQGRKNKYVCTVVDILRTYNSKNELVKVRYVSQHDFFGQTVTDDDVSDCTVARGLIENE